MGKYEETMEEMLKEEIGDGVILDDGWEYRIGTCEGCEYYGHESPGIFWCAYENNIRGDDSIRMVDGGEMADGKCFKYISFDEFWDLISSMYAINPKNGELFDI